MPPADKPSTINNAKPLRLHDFLPYKISVVSNTISSSIAAAYQSKFGLSIAEWRIMVILAEYPGVSADEVCRKTQMEKSIVSRAISKLLRRHLIDREMDETDRRKSILHLTDTGHAVFAEVMPVAKSYEQRFTRGLSGPEKKQLYHLLDKLFVEANAVQAEDQT